MTTTTPPPLSTTETLPTTEKSINPTGGNEFTPGPPPPTHGEH
jgi:hypothetical protein